MKKSIIKGRGMVFSVLVILALSALIAIGRPGSQQQEQDPAPATEEDMGKNPWVLNIELGTLANPHYRNARWTGEYLQMTFMSLSPGETIDLEVHNDHDQFIRIEQGEAQVLMGRSRNEMSFVRSVSGDWAIFIPAGYWHEVRNTGKTDLKLYTIYAPGEHPAGTIHETYQQALEQDHEHH